MDSGSPPAPPDPVVTANAQGAANIDAAKVQSALNRPNQTTPFGSLNWTAPTDGSNQWSSTVTLDPRIQNIVDSQLGIQQGLQGATNQQLGAVNSAFAQPINYAGMPAAGSAAGAQGAASAKFANNAPDIARQEQQAGLAGTVANQGIQQIGTQMGTALPDASEAARQQVIDSMYGQATSRLDPQYQQQEAAQRSNLMNRGIVEGSDAWKTEMDNLGRQKNDAYTSAMNAAIQGGGAEQTRLLNAQLGVRDQSLQEATAGLAAGGQANSDLNSAYATQGAQVAGVDATAANQFNMQNTAHQQALTEEQQKRAQAVNQLTALMTGSQTQMPQFSSGASGASVGAAPIAQTTQNAYQGALGTYNADVGSNNALIGAGASVGAAGLAAYMAPAAMMF